MKSPAPIALQPLEARRLMAASLGISTTAYAGGTMLKITGTAGNDTITVTQSGSAYTLRTAAGFARTVRGNFTAIELKGGRGNDRVTVSEAITTPVFVYGEDGNDTIHSGSGDDRLYGGAGTNWLYGHAGRDTLNTLGGNGNDGLLGGAGADFFWADNKSTEKIYDADAAELANSIHRVNAFETSRFITGTQRTEAVSLTPAGQRFRDPDVNNKAFVYKRFDNRPLFGTNGPTADDVRQGQVGDCYFLSALAGTADVSPDAIRNMMTDLGDGTFAVRFKSGTTSKFYRVDNDLAVFNKNSTAPAYAAFGQGGSMWVAVAEKAYAYARRAQGTYASLEGGWMNESFSALGLKAQQTKWNDETDNADEYLDWVQGRLDAGDVVTMAVLTGSDTLNLVGGHAYSVSRIETLADGTRQIIIRNPWGVDGYRTTDGANDAYVAVNASGAFSGIDAFVCAKAA